MRYYFTGTSNDIAKLAYSYDLAGNRRYQEDLFNTSGMDEFYQYDTLNRLTAFARGDLTSTRDGISGTAAREQAWTLDTVGNWSNEATKESGTYLRPYEDRTHNVANEVTARTFAGNSRIISYDDAGNLLTLQDNSGTTGWRYTCDHRNRLLEVEYTTDITAGTPTWTSKATYVYDGLNRRVKKDLDSGTDILYIYDGWQCIEERNAASPSTVLRQYVYGSQYIDEVVCKIEDPGGTPAKLFYLHDCNYNVVALTNTSGAVQERYNYEPYGGLTIAEDDYDVIPATTQNNSLTFQGQRYDAESGLYYFRNRYYSPVLGRFLQRDPADSGEGRSLYWFVEGNPPGLTDPEGLFPFWFRNECARGEIGHSVARIDSWSCCLDEKCEYTLQKTKTDKFSVSSSFEGVTVGGEMSIEDVHGFKITVKPCQEVTLWATIECTCEFRVPLHQDWWRPTPLWQWCWKCRRLGWLMTWRPIDCRLIKKQVYRN